MKDKHHNLDDEEMRKRRYLYIGVWVFSLAIALLWVANLKFSFQEAFSSSSYQEVRAVRSDLDDLLVYFQEGSRDINDEQELEMSGQLFLQEMSRNLEFKDKEGLASSDNLVELDPIKEDANHLLKNLENKIIQNTGCPQYINCMPGPDRLKPCSVPSGCENITQIAY